MLTKRKRDAKTAPASINSFGVLFINMPLLPRWCFSCCFSGFLLMFLGLISEYKYIIFWEFLEFFSIVEKD